MSTSKQFDFGQNWKNFSKNKLDEQKIEQAQRDFIELVKGIELENKTFIDIGFGQGLGLLTSAKLGAKSVGVDINTKCKETLEFNKAHFSELKEVNIPVIVGSVLDKGVMQQIKDVHETYDVIHSWGVLHHTGKMWEAIDNSCQLVKSKGKFILAIYNKHWSSKSWYYIKKLYNFSPGIIRHLMVYFFYVVIFMAKFLVTFKNPLKKERGMNFYYDVVDWVGGYPYEYASKEEVVTYMQTKGFDLIKYRAAEVPTGCNEFVFEKLENL